MRLGSVNLFFGAASIDGRQKFGFLLTVRNHFRKLETAEKGGGPDMIDQCIVCEVAET
jgi:hypothetical protein